VPQVLERSAASEARQAPMPLRAPSRSDDRRARDDLRRQIGALERELGELFAVAFPREGFEWRVGALGGPRVLSIGELERVRDALVRRLSDARAELARQAEIEEANRGLLESMIAAPERHRWVIVSNEDIGERGCLHWHSRPRWGILGMLLNWWRVRISSGCPLAKGPRPPESSELQEAKEAPAPVGRWSPAARRAAAEAEAGPGADRGGAAAGAVGVVPPGRARRPRRDRDPGDRILLR
jgi:hypothetical protein